MSKDILLIGAGEIGSYLKLFDRVEYCSHKDFNTIDFSKYRTIINCTFDKSYYKPNTPISQVFDWKVIDKAKKFQHTKFVFLSTRLVFDRSSLLITENSRFDPYPINEYARKKIILEQELADLKNIALVRLPNIFSSNTPQNRFFGQMLSNFLSHNRLSFNFDIDEFREFVFAGDVADFLYFVARNDYVGNVNFSYAIKHSMREFISIFHQEFGKCDVNYIDQPSNVQFQFDTSVIGEIYTPHKNYYLRNAMRKVFQEWKKL